uniref:Uncharacterized protein n=1 Tax=Lygus hesperus TaxID=30085 RepID=A0A0K8SI78_LYGHE
MDQTERLMLVDRMKFLVNELRRLETCCPTNVPCRTSPSTPQSQPPCFMIKCELPKCRSNPDLEPLITWTPVMEVRKTTNTKVCTHPPENPLVKHLYVDTLKRPSVCGTMDPCMGHCPVLRDHDIRMSQSRRRSSLFKDPSKCTPEKRNGLQPSGRPSLISQGPSKCTPAHRDGTVELCCPTFGPPVDSCGQPYHCQVTLDGRSVCKPTDDISTRPQTGCDRKQPQSRFSKCDEKKIPQRTNTRRSLCDQPKSSTLSRSSASKATTKGKPPGNYCPDYMCNCCNCSKQPC